MFSACVVELVDSKRSCDSELDPTWLCEAQRLDYFSLATVIAAESCVIASKEGSNYSVLLNVYSAMGPSSGGWTTGHRLHYAVFSSYWRRSFIMMSKFSNHGVITRLFCMESVMFCSIFFAAWVCHSLLLKKKNNEICPLLLTMQPFGTWCMLLDHNGVLAERFDSREP